MQNNYNISRKVYVIGPTKSANKLARKKRIDTLNIVCRRILVAKFIPVCPMLYCNLWIDDPRLSKDPEWWMKNVFHMYVHDCSLCCYIPSFAGQPDPFYDAEMDLWRAIGNGEFIVADKILDHLLELRTERIFDGF